MKSHFVQGDTNENYTPFCRRYLHFPVSSQVGRSNIYFDFSFICIKWQYLVFGRWVPHGSNFSQIESTCFTKVHLYIDCCFVFFFFCLEYIPCLLFYGQGIFVTSPLRICICAEKIRVMLRINIFLLQMFSYTYCSFLFYLLVLPCYFWRWHPQLMNRQQIPCEIRIVWIF